MTTGPNITGRPRRNKVTLTEFGKTMIRCSKLGIRTMIPARVALYNAATQTADVQMQHNIVLGDDGDEQELLPSIVPACPVAWPSAAAGTAYITMPLAPNDPGYLLISDRSLERWITQGVPVDPGSPLTHNIIDGVFHPSLRPLKDVLKPPTDPAATVIEGPLIKLGFGATEFALRASALGAACNVAIPTTIAGILNIVPNANDVAAPTASTLATANKAAILALCALIFGGVSTKTQVL